MEGHGKQGSLIAATKGTTITEVTKHLAKISEKRSSAVEEVTMDFSDSMMGITKQMFPNAEIGKISSAPYFLHISLCIIRNKHYLCKCKQRFI